MQISMHGEPLTTNGQPPVVGEQFPEFALKTSDSQSLGLTDLSGKVTLISVVPDIDTRVCSLSTKKFNQKVDQFPGINFLTISTNTPEQQQNWCAAADVTKIRLVSDQEHQLGEKLGIYVATKGIDSRSIWILDENGRIVYRELIIEQTNEPAYSQVLAKLTALTK